MSGVLRPDKGEIRIDGKRVEIASPKAAMRLGIETIYQDASMVPTMSIARNLFVGREPLLFAVGGIGLIDHDRMRREFDEGDRRRRSPLALARRPARRAIGRTTPGSRDRKGDAFQVAGSDPRRAHQSLVGEGNGQGARLRAQLAGPGDHRPSSSATTCTMCSSPAIESSRWRAARSYSTSPSPKPRWTRFPTFCEARPTR